MVYIQLCLRGSSKVSTNFAACSEALAPGFPSSFLQLTAWLNHHMTTTLCMTTDKQPGLLALFLPYSWLVSRHNSYPTSVVDYYSPLFPLSILENLFHIFLECIAAYILECTKDRPQSFTSVSAYMLCNG